MASGIPDFKNLSPGSGSQYAFLSREEVRSVLTDPAYTWRWVVVLPQVKGTVNELYNAGNGGFAQSPAPQGALEKTPYGLALNIEIQPDDLGTESRPGGATAVSYPRQCSTNGLSIQFCETKNYLMTRYLLAWKKEIVDADGQGLNNFGNPKDYKKNLLFFAFDITSNTKSIMQFAATDCYPTNAVGGLSYSTESGFITVATEFTVDGNSFYFAS